MFEGLLILILFFIGSCFCYVDLRYLTLRCRVGILACKIFSLFADFLFFMFATFFYSIFARLGIKKEELLIVNNSSDSSKQTNKLDNFTSFHLAIAGEACVRHLCVDGIVLPRHPWHWLDQPVKALVFLAGTETQDQEQAYTSQVNILTHPAPHILKQLTTGPEHGSGCKCPTCTLAQLSPRCEGCAFCTRGVSTRDLSGAPLNAGVELQRRPAARRSEAPTHVAVGERALS